MSTQTRELNIGLTAEQKENRKNRLGGSDANTVLSGDKKKIHNLWLEKTGQKEPENLDGVLPVVMGQFTEPLNIFWYEKQTGRSVHNEQLQLKHDDYDFMACTLDGTTETKEGNPGIFEAKHVNPFSNIEEVVQRYMPQLHHNMAVAGEEWYSLSIFVGTLKWELYEGEADIWYTANLVDQMKAFWECVTEKREPNNFDKVEAPKPKISDFREIDMDGSNEWASLAADYLDNEKAAKTFDKSKKGLKELVEDDVGLAYGAGIQIKRGKSGSLSFSKQK